MLILDRRRGQRLVVSLPHGALVEVAVLSTRRGRCRLAVSAPPGIPVDRGELPRSKRRGPALGERTLARLRSGARLVRAGLTATEASRQLALPDDCLAQLQRLHPDAWQQALRDARVDWELDRRPPNTGDPCR